MFETISIVGFVIVIAATVLDCAVRRPKLDQLFGEERGAKVLDPLRWLVLLLTMLLPEAKMGWVGVLRKLVYAAGLICFLVLVVTGFWPRLVLAEKISGYWLMIHVTAGGVFAVCLVLAVLTWAHRSSFNRSDCPVVARLLGLTRNGSGRIDSECRAGEKLAFWLIVVFSPVVILSVVLSMFPLFGTEMQKLLAEIHRYCALALALACIIHAHLMVRVKLKGWSKAGSQ